MNFKCPSELYQTIVGKIEEKQLYETTYRTPIEKELVFAIESVEFESIKSGRPNYRASIDYREEAFMHSEQGSETVNFEIIANKDNLTFQGLETVKNRTNSIENDSRIDAYLEKMESTIRENLSCS